MNEDLLRIIKGAIEPVSKKFELRVVGEDADRNYAEVRYANGSTGLRVAVDWSELRPFLTLSRLTDGKFPVEIGSDESAARERDAFDVDDLLLMRPVERSPVGKMLPGRDALAAGRLLADYARALDIQATDVLSGDFAVFEVLNRVVTERARRLGQSD